MIEETVSRRSVCNTDEPHVRKSASRMPKGDRRSDGGLRRVQQTCLDLHIYIYIFTCIYLLHIYDNVGSFRFNEGIL